MSDVKKTDLLKLAESGTNEEIDIYLGDVACKQFREDVKNVAGNGISIWVFLCIFGAALAGNILAYLVK